AARRGDGARRARARARHLQGPGLPVRPLAADPAGPAGPAALSGADADAHLEPRADRRRARRRLRTGPGTADRRLRGVLGRRPLAAPAALRRRPAPGGVPVTGSPAERPAPARRPPFRAALGRSAALFSAFRKEQTDPDLFYGTLARDTVDQLLGYTRLDGAVVVDVGGGPGYFADELRAAGAHCVCVAADAGEMRLRHGDLPRPAPDGRRDGPGDPAGRPGVPLLHAVAVPVGRARDLAVALPRRPLRRGALRPQARPPPQERLRPHHVRGLRRGDAALAAHPGRRHRGGRAAALPPRLDEAGGARPRRTRGHHLEPPPGPAQARLSGPGPPGRPIGGADGP